MRVEGGIEPVEVVLGAIRSLLANNTLLSLSTFDGNSIWTSTVFYSCDKHCSIYFISDPKTRHCRMISINNKVSGAIYSSMSKWGTDIQGLQFEAKAERVPIREIIPIGAEYLKRFPISQRFIASPELFNTDKISSRLYRLTPTVFQIYDEINFHPEPIRRLFLD